MTSAVFVVEIARCTGCQACQIACKDRAGLPDALDWLRVEAEEGGTYPNPALAYRVVHCFHCAAPPCTAACPTGAMAQHAGGLVVLDAVECTGCGACVEACPFGVIVLSPEGFASKCDGCPDELECGWEPTCVRACPLRALHYGATPDSGSLEARHLTVDAAFDGHGAGPAVVFLRRK